MAQFSANLRVGAESVTITTDSQDEYHKLVSLYREMDARVTKDAVFRVRKGDDYDYVEFYSPSLKAAKKISSSTKTEALLKDAPYAVYGKTPWIRFIYGKDGKSTSLVMWDGYIPDDIKELGFTESRVWYMGHFEDQGKTLVKDHDTFAMNQKQLEDHLRK